MIARRVLVTGFALALCLFVSAEEPKENPATKLINRDNARHKEFLKIVAKGEGDVIFIGDSITQGWEGEGKDVWARFYGPRNAINLGIGGDRTQHVLWRLENGNLKGLAPKAAVVMIGTNNSNGEDNTVEQIADGVTAIVKKPLIFTPRLLRERSPIYNALAIHRMAGKCLKQIKRRSCT
jgi:hypothetical protein